jgi:hypothetical protein
MRAFRTKLLDTVVCAPLGRLLLVALLLVFAGCYTDVPTELSTSDLATRATIESDAEGSFSELRKDIEEALTSYRKGQRNEAARSLHRSYNSIQQRELRVLRLRNPGLALGATRDMLSLLDQVENSGTLEDLDAATLAVQVRLDQAEEVLAIQESGASSLGASANLAFSLAIDGALTLFLLLIVASRLGADPKERKMVGVGLLAGFVGSGVLGVVNSVMPGSLQMLLGLGISGGSALLAAALPVLMIKHWRQPPQTQKQVTGTYLGVLLLLAAGAVARDTLEIVPPLQMMAGQSSMVLVGFAGMGVALVALVNVGLGLSRRLQPSVRIGVLIIVATLVAVMNAGSAANAAQAVGLLASHDMGSLQIPWLSMWPTEQSVMCQLVAAGGTTLALLGATMAIKEA